jgi:hypothetical protein
VTGVPLLLALLLGANPFPPFAKIDNEYGTVDAVGWFKHEMGPQVVPFGSEPVVVSVHCNRKARLCVLTVLKTDDDWYVDYWSPSTELRVTAWNSAQVVAEADGICHRYVVTLRDPGGTNPNALRSSYSSTVIETIPLPKARQTAHLVPGVVCDEPGVATRGRLVHSSELSAQKKEQP